MIEGPRGPYGQCSRGETGELDWLSLWIEAMVALAAVVVRSACVLVSAAVHALLGR